MDTHRRSLYARSETRNGSVRCCDEKRQSVLSKSGDFLPIRNFCPAKIHFLGPKNTRASAIGSKFGMPQQPKYCDNVQHPCYRADAAHTMSRAAKTMQLSTLLLLRQGLGSDVSSMRA